jgi:threonine synthase
MRWFYRCPSCGTEYDMEPDRYLCPSCARRALPNRPLEGVLECAWEGEWEGGPEAIPLPVEGKWFPSIPVGNTPLWAPERMRGQTGFPNLWIKDDTCEPTGSFKDRASYLVAAYARKKGIHEIALASTGNAASSMAGVGAAAGLKITVFLPKSAPVAKRIQVLQYGAELKSVDGTYDKAFDESLSYSAATGVLSRNTAYNPLTIEGKKTVSFELIKDLAAAGAPAPDHVFVPVGDGVILAGVYKGFEDLMRLGRLAKMPTVWACQARGSSAIARALASGGFGDPVPSSTIADSISVDVPRNGSYAIEKLKKHDGRSVVVTDEEILSAQHTLASQAGLFAEPSSCAVVAGFLKIKSELDPSSTAVLLVTGSGLKDVKSAAHGLGIS